MKKVSMFLFAVIIGIAFVSTTFAQAPAGTTEKKETTTTTTTTTKTKTMKFHGKVTNMDMAAKMMTVTGKKGDMTFDVSNAKVKGEINVGDKVRVKYMEQDGKMMASAVKVTKGKKMKTTTTTTTTEKKEETTAPAK